MQRGYLWERLAEEIVEEFARLLPRLVTEQQEINRHVRAQIKFSMSAARELETLPKKWQEKLKRTNRPKRYNVEREKPQTTKRRYRVPPTPTREALAKRKARATTH